MLEMNAVAMYDFRISAEGLDASSIIVQLKKLAKRFCFQKEKGNTTGYIHYQGRFSLIKKHRKCELLKLFDVMPVPNYLEPTVNEVHYRGDMFYVMKDETRVEGPWNDKYEELFIPRQYEGLIDKLYPYQQTIYNSINQFESRQINLIYDPKGNNGKSSIAAVCELYGGGIDMPPINDMKELMQVICDECYERTRNPGVVLIDLPRALDKTRLYGIYSAIEQVKKGKLYDTRYHFRKWWINSPQIWVFTNIMPDLNMLSQDRWNVFTIDDNKCLIDWEDVSPDQTLEDLEEIKKYSSKFENLFSYDIL